jgi:hypothetical protein
LDCSYGLPNVREIHLSGFTPPGTFGAGSGNSGLSTGAALVAATALTGARVNSGGANAGSISLGRK